MRVQWSTWSHARVQWRTCDQGISTWAMLPSLGPRLLATRGLSGLRLGPRWSPVAQGLRRPSGTRGGTGRPQGEAAVRDFIEANMEASREHLTPELTLRLLTPRCPLWTARPETWPFPADPYWAIYWPGGQVLARFLLDQPDVVAGRAVLDLGSGCGAAAIAAAKAGASIVVANDIDPVAAVAISLNAELNGVHADSLRVDVRDLLLPHRAPSPPWDVLLLGDMFYDGTTVHSLLRWLETSLAQRRRRRGQETDPPAPTVLVGDPGRPVFLERYEAWLGARAAATAPVLRELARYELPESARRDNSGLSDGAVWTLHL
ncbi:electron transfer flavoprotein beta subunit lysine methyltransferase isoform X1 [Lethenteron reissneri]|uniref:electron transfer flavoprotein beta subunit lysine methyltransferase isoform X1 n=2 Tax=Lethenteron reissneri TaxID=7753 RepID=UPI002AB75659|nr:electron transfer flavoprotein beta subunit lysine methyltransferase isoform X1 [Lethenteron reissneri]